MLLQRFRSWRDALGRHIILRVETSDFDFVQTLMVLCMYFILAVVMLISVVTLYDLFKVAPSAGILAQ